MALRHTPCVSGRDSGSGPGAGAGRTRQVNDELDRKLRGLDGFAWHIERDLLICSVPIPFVLLGPSGLFLLQASRGQRTVEDIALMSTAARTLSSVLSDYPDATHPAIVMLEDDQPPRQHFTGAGEGPCWVLGDDSLSGWLHRFRDHGLSQADIAVLRDHSDPARIRERKGREALVRFPGPQTHASPWRRRHLRGAGRDACVSSRARARAASVDALASGRMEKRAPAGP